MIKIYSMLMKPGIIMGNVITAAAGFALASKGHLDLFLFLAIIVGLAFVIGSACVFNNYIDRKSDRKMERTKNRALAKGLISGRNALVFGCVLLAAGILVLSLYTNLLTVLIATFGFFVYVALYSVWKYLSIYGTIIGSVSGAVPPVVGYCGVTNQFDGAALLLFLVMVLWQMPHFFSIAMYRLEDYRNASIPVLPLLKGNHITKIHMIIYIVAFTLTGFLLTVYGYTGMGFLLTVALLGVAWLILGFKGFKSVNDTLWARQMFRLSLVIVTIMSVVMTIDGSLRKANPATKDFVLAEK